MGGLIEVTSRAAKASLQRTVPVTSRLFKEAGAAGPQRPLGLARMYDLIGGGGRSGQREQPVLGASCPREAGRGDTPWQNQAIWSKVNSQKHSHSESSASDN